MLVQTDSKGKENPAFDNEGCSDDVKLQTVKPEDEEINDLPKEKLPYPKSIAFIVGNEFCERFSFYGLRTILSLYLKYQLNFDNDFATVIYHVFIMLCYFFPILGAILADSWLGKFRTIFWLSTVYTIGNIIVSLAAIPNFIPRSGFTIFGLFLIALGTGGIKPCTAAFGGDQFILPQQEVQLQKFFSLFYFAINLGSLFSTLLTPVLREDVKCFDEDSCYCLAFGVPAVLMVTSLVVFVSGKRWYKIKEPEGNIIVKVSKCMWYAARKKSTEKREHWLYNAADKYDRKFIEDVRATLRVLVLVIPLPVFWALFDQQGSRWTFQASRMDVDVGGVKIKPDQMQVVNPILILIFIPLFESVIYPLFTKCNILRRPLQKLVVGGLLAGASFFVSALLETKLETTYPVLPNPGEGQLRLINSFSEDINLTVTVDEKETNVFLKPNNIYEDLHINVLDSSEISIKIPKYSNETFRKQIYELKAVTLFFIGPERDYFVGIKHEDIDKSPEGDPKLMILIAHKFEENQRVQIYNEHKNYSYSFNSSTPITDLEKLPTNEYNVKLNDREIGKIHPQQGGLYSLIINTENTENKKINMLTITEPNSVCILWIIPQYVIITAGEIMFSVTGLEFAFTQAPVSMKSLMQAAWLFTTAIGNLIVVIVARSKVFSSQTYEFLLFGSLMVVDMVIFALMAMRYTYVEDLPNDESNELELDPAKPKDSRD